MATTAAALGAWADLVVIDEAGLVGDRVDAGARIIGAYRASAFVDPLTPVIPR